MSKKMFLYGLGFFSKKKKDEFPLFIRLKSKTFSLKPFRTNFQF